MQNTDVSYSYKNADFFIYMYIHVSYFCSKYRLCVHKKKSLELPLSEAVLMSTQNPCLSKKKKKKERKKEIYNCAVHFSFTVKGVYTTRTCYPDV